MQNTNECRAALIAGLATFAIHLAGNPHYGFFRDELYFIICGQHPQWGYVDQPPVAPILAAASQMLGHSLVILRAVPALFAAGGVYAACLLALEIGGGVYAEILTALVVFFAPVLVSFGMKVSPDMVGLWLWPLAMLYVVRLTKGADPRWWLAIGAIIGVCIQSKYSVVFFAGSMLAGLLLTAARRILFTRWFIAGGVLAGLIALPNFLWQAHFGFPMLELLRNVQHGKNVNVGPLTYVFQQILIMGLFLSVVWIIGWAWLLWNSRFRFLGYAFPILIGLMIVMHGKHYYPADAYPCLMAAGAVAMEDWTRGLRIARAAIATAVLVVGIAFLPLTMPVLPEQQFVSYRNWLMNSLHIRHETLATEHQREAQLGSDYADMHGWPELAEIVSRVYQSLPPSDRAEAVVVAQNYGEAAAIEFFGAKYGVPPVISGHNQYFLWGPQGHSGNVVICVGGNCDDIARAFTSVELAARFSAPWIQPYEDGIPIMVCRGIKRPLAELWPQTKLYR